jgi:hypothetical protein
VYAVAYSPDGSRIASASGDKTLKVWDATTGQNLFPLIDAFNPLDPASLGVWHTRTGQEVLISKRHRGEVYALAFSPDGSCLASGESELFEFRDARDEEVKVGMVEVWDARSGQRLMSFQHLDRKLGPAPAAVRAVAFSPDGSHIVSGGGDGTLMLWEASTGQALLSLKGHVGDVFAVAFSPDGSRILSGSRDRTLKVWDARSGQELLHLKGHTDSVAAVSYSPDGSRIVSASHDRTLKVWDALTGQELLTLKGHTDPVHAVAFSPDGSRIASGSGDNTLKLWEAPTQQDQRFFKGHLNAVARVAFGTEAKHAFGRDKSGKILAWEIGTGRPLPDSPTVMPLGNGLTATFGNYRAEAFGNLLRVERTFTAEEQNRRAQEQARAEAIRRARASRAFHEAEAKRTRKIDPFSAVFHLDRLLALSPDERPALLKRRSTVLSAAIEKDANDHHSARSLARQAVADFDTIDNPTSLLSTVARHQHSSLDRLHGALLLRTGNARDAALVFRAAIRNRTSDDVPPIDELLLALALIKLGRRDEARQFLTKVADWMDNGTAPQRLASLLGARPAGPLAALAAVAHVPDPRLNPLDPFTAHDLDSLRREAETALTDER